MTPKSSLISWSLILLLLLASCKGTQVKRELKTVQEISAINPDREFVKAHMKDGTVYILHHWQFNQQAQQLTGYGKKLGINREVQSVRLYEKGNTSRPKFEIDATAIALIETNDLGNNLSTGLAVVTGVSVLMTALCLTNPKACFGSCPTFYASNGDTLTLQAEGFSTSVAPSLEKNDIDMLYHAVPSKKFQLVVTNEALETHSIRQANLLAFTKEPAERVFVTPESDFYKCTGLQAPARVVHENKDITDKLVAADGKEFFTITDGKDLQAREEINITFENNSTGPYGIVIGKRQSLLTTFLMYQGLSYMGATATYWLAQLEMGKQKKDVDVFKLLGGIEVFAQNEEGEWILQGQVNETGPIAADFTVIPINEKNASTIKLRMTKGLWRLDYISLATMKGKTKPIVVTPSFVERVRGREEDPFRKLTDPDLYLVTYPGDCYKIEYELPDSNCELFLDSRGFYLEWMRDAWIKEQNLRKLRFMVNQPAKYLKKIAPEYKKLEPTMEKSFWESRYVKN
jgi:hypothetical protein